MTFEWKSYFSKTKNLFVYSARYFFDKFATIGLKRDQTSAVILVRLDGIGDFVVWLNCAKALREHYRNQQIILIANAIFAELAERTGYFDQVIKIDLNAFITDWRYRYKMIREVYQLGAKVAIQPTYSRLYEFGDAIIRATGADERIGSHGDYSRLRPWQRRIANRWYTKLVKASHHLLMECERNSEFLHGLGIADANLAKPELPQVTELPDSLQIHAKYYIIFPGAGNWRRMWPVEKFSKVARYIDKEYGWRMVVCGTESENDIARQLMEKARIPKAVNLTGRTSLAEFVELVRGASLLIGNETSAVHIAAAVDTPSVCLLGGGHFKRFIPYPSSFNGSKPVPVYEYMDCFGCNWRCTLPIEEGGPDHCISRIQLQDVLDAVQLAIKGG